MRNLKRDMFTSRFGVPTNIDLVWNVRELHQGFYNQDRYDDFKKKWEERFPKKCKHKNTVEFSTNTRKLDSQSYVQFSRPVDYTYCNDCCQLIDVFNSSEELIT